GTHAAAQRRLEKEQARKDATQGPLTSRDRPRPKAAYEPSGNANGRDTAQQNARIEQTLKPLGIGGPPADLPELTSNRRKHRSSRGDDGWRGSDTGLPLSRERRDEVERRDDERERRDVDDPSFRTSERQRAQ